MIRFYKNAVILGYNNQTHSCKYTYTHIFVKLQLKLNVTLEKI